jgi:hypothetical protein
MGEVNDSTQISFAFTWMNSTYSPTRFISLTISKPC